MLSLAREFKKKQNIIFSNDDPGNINNLVKKNLLCTIYQNHIQKIFLL